MFDKPPNGIHPDDLALLKRVMTFYGPELTLRAFAAVCDDHAMQIAATDASEAKSWLAMSARLENVADSIEEME